LGDKEYDRLYGSLKHQFYEKDWFADLAEKCGLKCEMRDQNIKKYENAKFRYNVFLEKSR